MLARVELHKAAHKDQGADMTTIRTRIAAVAGFAALCAVLLVPASAQAWRGNDFKSPSGNIVCHYAGNWIACATLNNSNVVVVDRTHAYHSFQRTFGTRGYVLGYGKHYTTDDGRFICLSSRNGMGCENRRNGHGFAINASGWRTF
jgi:hypothetical protein